MLEKNIFYTLQDIFAFGPSKNVLDSFKGLFVYSYKNFPKIRVECSIGKGITPNCFIDNGNSLITLPNNKLYILQLLNPLISKNILHSVWKFMSMYNKEINIGFTYEEEIIFNVYYSSQYLSLGEINLILREFGYVHISNSKYFFVGIQFTKDKVLSIKVYDLYVSSTDFEILYHHILYDFKDIMTDFMSLKRYHISGKISYKSYVNVYKKNIYLTQELMNLFIKKGLDENILKKLIGNRINSLASSDGENLEVYFDLFTSNNL